jgi:hypothetical protein
MISSDRLPVHAMSMSLSMFMQHEHEYEREHEREYENERGHFFGIFFIGYRISFMLDLSDFRIYQNVDIVERGDGSYDSTGLFWITYTFI